MEKKATKENALKHPKLNFKKLNGFAEIQGLSNIVCAFSYR
jgi:hypothetical protein